MNLFQSLGSPLIVENDGRPPKHRRPSQTLGPDEQSWQQHAYECLLVSFPQALSPDSSISRNPYDSEQRIKSETSVGL